MRVVWSKAIWWVLFVLMLYAAAMFFVTACSRPHSFENGDNVHGRRPDPDGIVERDMPQFDKSQR